MKILHFLIFVFLSDPAVLVKARLTIYSAAEGGNATLNCHLTLPGSTKFFCKGKCERAEDILIKTDGSTAQSGRYSMKYKDGSSGKGIVSVTFTHMIKSDSGLYRCGLGKSSAPDSYFDFEVRVSNDLDKNSGFTRTETEGEAVTLGCAYTVYGQRKFFCKNECKNEGEILIDTSNDKSVSGRYSIEYTAGSLFGLYVTITQLTKSDTGGYRCGYGNPLSPDSYYSTSLVVIGSNPHTSTPQATTKTTQTPTTTTAQSQSFTPKISTSSSDCPHSSLGLVVCVSLIGVLLMAVFILLLYIYKTRRNTALNIRENAGNKNMEFSGTYENWGPPSQHKGSKDQDHVYSAL
ncbi:polymeric immunoglobulin receptor-like [Simochromis diagramma]|uniref:polymeric immunoglobulin receptor-like n=1 Tax=Simochromis diagramma TaxID=43689 RepID=UPI001A7E643A|nr:polymeric immunoglobulin receptor-like [Simochromis diagramma]